MYTVGQTIEATMTGGDAETKRALYVTLDGKSTKAFTGRSTYDVALISDEAVAAIRSLVEAGKVEVTKVHAVSAAAFVAPKTASTARKDAAAPAAKTYRTTGSTCRRCGGPCADGSGDCGECR